MAFITRSLLLSSALLASLVFGAAGCKQIKKADGEAVASASPSGSAAPTTPCGIYAEKFCEVVGGPTAAQCTQLKGLSEVLPEAACNAGLKEIDFTKGKIAEAKKKCDELVVKLCKGVGEDTDSCKMVKTRTATFPPDACEQMLSRTDEIIKQLQAEEAKNKPLSAEKQAELAAATAPSKGPADAKVTLVEFSDFQCPYCSRAATALDTVAKDLEGKVRIVFRQFPLSFHKDAPLASQAALAANDQGKFWELHDKMFANQKAISREDIEKYAQEIGLNMTKFKEALDKETFKAQVEADMKLGESVFVRGTPSVFINGKRAQNAIDAEALKKEIEPLLK